MHQTILFLLQKEHSSKFVLFRSLWKRKEFEVNLVGESNTNAQGFNEISKGRLKKKMNERFSYSATSARLVVLRDPSEWRRMKDATHVSCVTIPSSPIENPSGFKSILLQYIHDFLCSERLPAKHFKSPICPYDILKCFHCGKNSFSSILFYLIFGIRYFLEKCSWEKDFSVPSLIQCHYSLLKVTAFFHIWGYSSVCFLMCSKREWCDAMTR